MLTLHLKPIFKARAIDRPYSFLVKAGFSPHAANSILNSATRVFRLDHIELLCDALNCEPNDLLQWTADKNKVYHDNYPLKQLEKVEIVEYPMDVLNKMTYKELKENVQDVTRRTTYP